MESCSQSEEGQTALKCPLCGAQELAAVEQLSGKELRLLWRSLNCEFPPEAWGKIRGEYVVIRWTCKKCGFSFFDPSLAGTEAFYRQLDNPNYYSAARPEFERTVRFAKRNGLRRVLDVGCGSGAFLDLARSEGCETFGVELNSNAAQRARLKGHRVFERLLHELQMDEIEGPFDLITFFQVLEHVPKPVAVMRQAGKLIRKNGYIAVAVPSAKGVYCLVPWDPHQWPPHHLSRWRLEDFPTLAGAAQLQLGKKGGDVLLGRTIEYFWNLSSRLSVAMGQSPRFGGDSLARAISFAYRKTGMKFIFPRRGNSIYAFFKKP